MASTESYAIRVGERILVTGANGFIGSNIVDFLLSLGYIVRGTVRSEKSWLTEMFELKYGAGRFESRVVPALDDKEALTTALDSISGVVHVASDVRFSADPNKVIPYVVAATEAVLEAASSVTSVKRVVLTSSSAAAVIPQPGKDTWKDASVQAAWDESTSAEIRGFMVYAASKTEGERAAFNWVKKNNPGFILNSVLPDYTIGEVLHPSIGSIGYLTTQFLEGNETVINRYLPVLLLLCNCPNLTFRPLLTILSEYFVDARDLARLHAITLFDPSVQSERLFGLAAPCTWKDVIGALHELRPSSEKLARNVPPAREGFVQIVPPNRSKELLSSFFRQSD
ncbi:hypothetical protein LTR56_004864 [Elasticomyces elasticus]|nr:hypothetical protein LTR56_004864 [Elasticomyces elasticus]